MSDWSRHKANEISSSRWLYIYVVNFWNFRISIGDTYLPQWQTFPLLKQFIVEKIDFGKKSEIWFPSTHCGNGQIKWGQMTRYNVIEACHPNVTGYQWRHCKNFDPYRTYTYGYKIVGIHVIDHVTIIHVMWQRLLRVFDIQSNYFKVQMTHISHMTCRFDSSIIKNTFLTVQELPDWFHFLSVCHSNDIS